MARTLTDRPVDEAAARPPLRLLPAGPAAEAPAPDRLLEARRLHPAFAHLAEPAEPAGPAVPRLHVVPAVAS